jgi:hypothetical protein
MSRATDVGKIVLLFWGLAFLVLAALQNFGHLEQDVANLSGKAILAAEQRGAIADFITVYPPLPLLLSLPFALLAPPGVPAASLASGLVAALFGAMLHAGLLRRGAGRQDALAITLLILLNPFALYALAAGPGPMLLMLGMLMLAFGLFGMAGGETAVSDAMMTALALALLALAHPYGLILVLASLPGLALAAPPGIMARTPGSLFLILLFPVVFALASFIYTRWVLGTDPLQFLNVALGALQPGERGQPLPVGLFLAAALPSLILIAPPVLAFLVWSRGRKSQLLPALALTGTVILAGVGQIVLRGHIDMALAMAMILPASGVCAAQAVRDRNWQMLLLPLIGVGGAWAVSLAPAVLSGRSSWLPAHIVTPPAKKADRLGAALCGKSGVLVDTDAYPGVVQLCGTAKGIVAAGEAEFDLQLLSRRLTSPFILVADTVDGSETDRIAHSFPELYARGAEGYQLIHDAAGWRLYARRPARPVS